MEFLNNNNNNKNSVFPIWELTRELLVLRRGEKHKVQEACTEVHSLPSVSLRPAPSAGAKRPLAAFVVAADTERESVHLGSQVKLYQSLFWF